MSDYRLTRQEAINEIRDQIEARQGELTSDIPDLSDERIGETLDRHSELYDGLCWAAAADAAAELVEESGHWAASAAVDVARRVARAIRLELECICGGSDR